MGRPPMIQPEKKTRIVLAILSGEMSIAEAARKEKVSEQSIGRWKAEFIEAGRTALVAGRSGSSREEQLEAKPGPHLRNRCQGVALSARRATGNQRARAYLHPNGGLGDTQPTLTAGPSTFIHDPADPTPAVGGPGNQSSNRRLPRQPGA
jgi:transposase